MNQTIFYSRFQSLDSVYISSVELGLLGRGLHANTFTVFHCISEQTGPVDAGAGCSSIVLNASSWIKTLGLDGLPTMLNPQTREHCQTVWPNSCKASQDIQLRASSWSYSDPLWRHFRSSQINDFRPFLHRKFWSEFYLANSFFDENFSSTNFPQETLEPARILLVNALQSIVCNVDLPDYNRMSTPKYPLWDIYTVESKMKLL